RRAWHACLPRSRRCRPAQCRRLTIDPYRQYAALLTCGVSIYPALDLWDREPMGGTRLTLRVDFDTNRSIGPGKIRLLEAIARTGSISQAGRSLGMSYRRAWLLIDDMNRCFNQSVTTAQPGGAQGGGAALTDFGKMLVRNYRGIEMAASNA